MVITARLTHARTGATPLPPPVGLSLGNWKICGGRLYRRVAYGSGCFDELSSTAHRTSKCACLIPHGAGVVRCTPVGGGVYDVSFRYRPDNCATTGWDPPEGDRSYGELCLLGGRVSGV